MASGQPSWNVHGLRAGIAYIHSDQVAQPQKLTDNTGAVTWDRVATPFGETTSLTAGGGIDLALRFPGQQIDAGTGLAYNYMRDYDSSLGRYVQSDPIGLRGRINTYGYVGGNPINYMDSRGLWSTEVHNIILRSYFYHAPGFLAHFELENSNLAPLAGRRTLHPTKGAL